MAESLVETWRRIIVGGEKSWVLFEHGTCVILMETGPDLAAQAVEIMRRWGPVHAGSSAGDFATITLTDAPGWVVTGHHPDMLTYVSPEEMGDKEMGDEDASDLAVGLLGRSKRDQDGADLQVVHVEDRRGVA